MACSCVDEWLLTIPDLKQAQWSEFRTGSIRTTYHLACAGNFTTNIRLWHDISEISATISHMNPAVKFNLVRYKHNHITQREAVLIWRESRRAETCDQEHCPQPTTTACAVKMCSGYKMAASTELVMAVFPCEISSFLLEYTGLSWVSGAVFSAVSISKIVDECLEIWADIGTGVFKPTIGHWWGTPANVRLSDVFRGHWETKTWFWYQGT